MTNIPTPDQFRAIGFTTAAAFPLSSAGLAIIAEHNGVSIDRLPAAARYSSNAWMHRWIEALGHARIGGRPIRDADGRWHSPKELGQ